MITNVLIDLHQIQIHQLIAQQIDDIIIENLDLIQKNEIGEDGVRQNIIGIIRIQVEVIVHQAVVDLVKNWYL